MPRKWLYNTQYYFTVIVCGVLPMAKTHLEHQLIKFKNKYGNSTTSTQDPYENYDPLDGVTTALILGMTYLLVIIYLCIKYGRQKCKKTCCDSCVEKRRELRNRKRQADGENQDDDGEQHAKMLPELNVKDRLLADPKWRNQLSEAYQLSKELGIPIIIKGENTPAKVAIDTPTTLHCKPEAKHTESTVRSVSTPPVQCDTYTMLLTENTSRPSLVNRPTKSGSIHSRQNSQNQLLPPSANQVLRTAQWVNTLNNKSIDSTDEYLPSVISRKLSSPSKLEFLSICDETQPVCTTKVEINHRAGAEQEMKNIVSDLNRNIPGGSGSKELIGRGEYECRKVDLATSEV